jgi:SAM-dependent methyltransferase
MRPSNQQDVDPWLLADYYSQFYFATYDAEPYSRENPTWQRFFGSIADAVVAEISPRTALDAGCGIGLLVEALRDRGVDAWGIDVSSYAISQVRDDLAEYCRVASITDELDGQFDLIISIEVLEHLPEHLAHTAVANIAAHCDDVLFSSSPSDFRDPSHQNVQPPGYWVRLFARHGFYRDLDFDATFVSPHARRFRRTGPVLPVLDAYERRLARLETEIQAVREVNMSYSEDRANLTQKVEELQAELDQLRER